MENLGALEGGWVAAMVVLPVKGGVPATGPSSFAPLLSGSKAIWMCTAGIPFPPRAAAPASPRTPAVVPFPAAVAFATAFRAFAAAFFLSVPPPQLGGATPLLLLSTTSTSPIELPLGGNGEGGISL